MLDANSVADKNPLPVFCTLMSIPLMSEPAPDWRPKICNGSISPTAADEEGNRSFTKERDKAFCAVAGPFVPDPIAVVVTLTFAVVAPVFGKSFVTAIDGEVRVRLVADPFVVSTFVER
jgi:hypothetical protein